MSDNNKISTRNNPVNPAHELFKKLTRIFSGPMINYRQQTEASLNHRNIIKYGNRFKNPSGQQFHRQHYNPFEALQTAQMVNHSRVLRYYDFQQMEFYPELASALDLYADEMTTHSSLSPMLTIKCPNEEIKDILSVLFKNILNVDFNLYGWCRTMCKLGDFFLYLDTDDVKGVTSIIPVPTDEVERLEGQDKTNPGYIQYQWNRGGMTLENWQMAHFRILGNDKFAPYGTSVLDPARRIWRQLTLLEDAMMSYRIVRSPSRRVFYIDVGNIDPKEIEGYIEKVKTNMKRNQVVNPDSGQVDLRYNPLPVSYLTKIPLLDGRNLTIRDVAKEYEAGKELWVYSKQDKTDAIVPGKVKWCGKNYTATKMIKVWLDDESYVYTAPEHPYIRRDGTYVRADKLVVGDSLMPFYRKTDSKGYEKVMNLNSNKYENTHALIAHNVYKEVIPLVQKPIVVHHKHPELGERNKLNNEPNNLELMNFWEHRKMHAEHAQLTLNSTEQLDVRRKRIIEQNKSEIHRNRTKLRNKRLRLAQKMGEAYNGTELHKQHNFIRSEAMKKTWADPQKSLEVKENMTIKFDNICFQYVVNTAKKLTKKISMPNFCLLLKNNKEFIKYYRSINTIKRDITKSIHKERLLLWVQNNSYLDYYDFLEKNREVEMEFRGGSRKKINHKVAKIELIECIEGHDVYCMTVVGPNNEEDRHNFAVCSDFENGEFSKCGILLVNSVEEDYFIAVRGQSSGNRIDTLPGGDYTGDIEDVKYLRDKLFSAIKVPMSYLSRGDGSSEDKTSLSLKDVRFARTIQRLQSAVVAELEKIGLVHLIMLGFKNEDLLSFKLSLNNPSKIAELQELEHWRTRFDVASAATDGYFSKSWIAKKMFNMSDEEILRNQREMFYDRKIESELDAISQAAEAQASAAADSGIGGDEEELKVPDLEDKTLLAEPPRRSDEPTTTLASRGKLYFPVKDDQRDMGARKRHMQSQFSKESSSSTDRNIFKGTVDSTLKSLGNGITEEKQPIYMKEEKNIFAVNNETKQLIKLLEERKKKDNDEK